MRTITLPWETWRAVIAMLRGTELSYAHDHADVIEGKLDQGTADQSLVHLAFTDAVSYRASRSRQSPYEFRRGADGIVGGLGVEGIHIVGD